MSSPTVQSAPSTQHGRQWWSRKQNSMSQHTQLTAGSEPPRTSAKQALALDERSRLYQLPTADKTSMKFHTFASVMGFKSKKAQGSPSLDLHQQQSQLPQRLRLNTTKSIHPSSSAGRARAQTIDAPGKPAASPVVAKSPTELSIRTVQSSVESFEPLTPLDVPRNRTSYQPSLFTYSEHDPLPDFIRVERDSINHDQRRASVMSDPSVIDPHMKSELRNAFSRSIHHSAAETKKPPVRNSRSNEGLSPPSTSYGKTLNGYVLVFPPSRYPPPQY